MFEELSLHILNIGMNSITAGAKTLQIVVVENARCDPRTRNNRKENP